MGTSVFFCEKHIDIECGYDLTEEMNLALETARSSAWWLFKIMEPKTNQGGPVGCEDISRNKKNKNRLYTSLSDPRCYMYGIFTDI